MSEVAKKIREELKAKGYNSRKISVKASYPGYEESIKVTIKDLSININEVKEVANKYRSVGYCERSGEILAGGNTFVNVEYDWKIVKEARELLMEEAEEIIAKSEGKNYRISEDGDIIVNYMTDAWNFPVVDVYKKVPMPEGNGHYLDRKYRHIAHNAYHIAEALVYIKNKAY